MRIYQTNIEKYKDAASRLKRKSDLLSMYRLCVFVLSGLAIFILRDQSFLLLFLVIAPLCVFGFGFLVRRHTNVDNLAQYTSSLREINEHEMLRHENKLTGFASGDKFIDSNHPYASDLDIFGNHSIFQLINRTTTEQGERQLADWLSTAAPNIVILKRQEAVKELSPMLEWRQHFHAAGMQFRHTKDEFDQLLSLVEKPVRLLTKKAKYITVCVLLSLLSTSAAAYFLRHAFALNTAEDLIKYSVPLIIMLLINSMVLRKFRYLTDEFIKNIHRDIKLLQTYQSLSAKIESAKFQSELLRKLQSSLCTSNTAKEIKRLVRMLEVLKLKGGKRQFNNFFYSAANALWFMDVYLIIAVEQWKAQNSSILRTCVDAVSDFEVLSSLAGFHCSNPSFAFPEIVDEQYHFDFNSVGHPLINREKRVYNDFCLSDRGNIGVVTGSNMSGKSTFLRALGMNAALALMGAPCCAQSGRISNIRIFSSMRTMDSLEEGVSSFYAELKRIAGLLNLLKHGHAVFFVLDEVFKGTNSKDRCQGGYSLIKQLSKLNSIGLISTHDLELAAMAEKRAGAINYSFNSTLQNNELIFDFALTKGVCRDANAIELMRRSGIEIL
ncbi:DNA mismatch repair protein MutS [Chryseolinea sp. T2]|uniref:MutS-related protein n=1 Tax=Chryseolinea sp. T2 TaxID=3129255 RepID=UPI003076956C